MKYSMAILAALLVAAISAVGVSVIDSDTAVAAGGQAKKCGGGTISLNANELAAFKKHNSIRRNRGLSQLCVHPALQEAARKHSRDMIKRDYFDHTTKGTNRGAEERIEAAGYRKWRTYGENIGYNSTPQAMMNAWMGSSGHRANILNGSFKEVGIGVVTGKYGRSTVDMYTVDFGARR